MKKASELRKSLEGILSDEEIARVVSAQIQKGELEDDSTDIDPDLVAQVASEIKKSLEATANKEGEEIQKGELPVSAVSVENKQGETWLNISDSFESFAKSVNAQSQLLTTLIKANSSTDSNLAKGLMAVGKLTELNINAVRGLMNSIDALQKSVSGIQERLSQPVAPRSYGFAPVPHPTESRAGEQTGQVVQKSGVDVMRAVKQELRKAHESGNQNRVLELAQAATALEAGRPASEVVEQFGITV